MAAQGNDKPPMTYAEALQLAFAEQHRLVKAGLQDTAHRRDYETARVTASEILARVHTDALAEQRRTNDLLGRIEAALKTRR